MLPNILNYFKNRLIRTAIDRDLIKTNLKYANSVLILIITDLHFSNSWKRSQATQVPLAGRVIDTVIDTLHSVLRFGGIPKKSEEH